MKMQINKKTVLYVFLVLIFSSCDKKNYGDLTLENDNQNYNDDYDNNISNDIQNSEIQSLNLQSITFSNDIILNEAVNENLAIYTADVGIGLSSFKLTSILASIDGASFTINGVVYDSNKDYMLSLGENEFELVISKDGLQKAYSITITRGKDILTYVKASNTASNDYFGVSVAISGDTMVVGAHTKNSVDSASGAAYVFTREGSIWTQQAYLTASNAGILDTFGRSVSISGDIIVVGAPGENSNATGVNGDEDNNTFDDSGAAYVFKREGVIWSQEAYLKASSTTAGDAFGLSVAVSGDTVVVGSYREDSNATGVNGDDTNEGLSDSGAAYVFKRTDLGWIQEAYLKASNAGAVDNFGITVAISEDTVVVGATGEDSNATGVNGDDTNNSSADSGAVYVFKRTELGWSQEVYLKASNTESADQFGGALSISGSTIVVRAHSEDSNATGVNGDQNNNGAINSGAVYVFKREGGIWSQEAYLKASNTESGDQFGLSLSVSGDTIVIGASEDSNATGINGDQNNNGAIDSGAAYVFKRTDSVWTQEAYLKASNPDASDLFAISLSISGDTIVIGARAEDSNATGINGNQTDNSLSFSGAVYIFE